MSFVMFKCLLVLAVIHGFSDNTTRFPEDGTRKREGKKQIPTFVGSDGVVRKVTPSAILDEMKRCLPPGIPVPAAVWPDLPPHLGEEASEGNDVTENDTNLRTKPGCGEEFASVSGNTIEQREERKRVMRSHAEKSKSDGSSSEGLDVKLEMPTRESVIFSPTAHHRKFADVLKGLFANQQNSTGFEVKYVDEDEIVDRLKKKPGRSEQVEDYQDYEYEDHPNNRPVSKAFHGQPRLRKPKHSRRRGTVDGFYTPDHIRHRYGKKPAYSSYDATEDQRMTSEPDDRVRTNRQADCGAEELERQMELNECLNVLCKKLGGSDDKTMEKYPTTQHSTPGDLDSAKDYKTILATVMELNSSLVRLLERAIASTKGQKSMKNEEPDKISRADDKPDKTDCSATSFILECMELLMQKRKGLREKRQDSTKFDRQDFRSSEKHNFNQHHSKRDQQDSKTPFLLEDLNFLKCLVKWYLALTM